MVNDCTFIGNVGKDPETRKTESGHKVSGFSIACNERYKKQDGTQAERTEWVSIICWDRMADIAEQYLKKGAQVYVRGKLRTRSYEGNDGVKRYVSEIYATELKMLGRKEERAPMPSSPEESDSVQAPKIPDFRGDDGLPF